MRSAPLKQRTPLKPGKGFAARSEPMARTSTLSRSKPLQPGNSQLARTPFPRTREPNKATPAPSLKNGSRANGNAPKRKRRADYLKEAQAAINAWVREGRDRDQPCISCGCWHAREWHAGHYLARGSAPHLALVPDNLAKQCEPCNVALAGNRAAFRIGLIARIGLPRVEALEADTTPRKYSIDDLKAIRAAYRAKLRAAK